MLYTVPVAPMPKEVGQWVVLHNWSWRDITVEKGFITDLDSVVRIPFIYSHLKGRAVLSPIMHDYLYCCNLKDRKEADRLFYECMLEEGVKKFHAILIYSGVRIFGGIHKKLKPANYNRKVSKGLKFINEHFDVLPVLKNKS